MKLHRSRAGKHTLVVVEDDPELVAVVDEPTKRTINLAVLAQYIYNLVIAVLIVLILIVMSQFSDYLNQRGKYADRERQQQRDFICELIGQLQANPDDQLYSLAERLRCTERPRPRPPAAPTSTSSVPIGGGGTLSTGNPTPGNQAPTGNASNGLDGSDRATGTKVPAQQTEPSRTTEPQPTQSPPPTSAPSVVCVPVLDMCI
jgi:hypothetical protein